MFQSIDDILRSEESKKRRKENQPKKQKDRKRLKREKRNEHVRKESPVKTPSDPFDGCIVIDDDDDEDDDEIQEIERERSVEK